MRTKIGYALMASAVLACFGNWLWLVGVLDRPDTGLMVARWAYGSVAFFIGVVMTLEML